MEIQLQFPSRTGRSQGKAIQNVESVGMLQGIYETNHAGIITVYHRVYVDFGHAALVRLMLVKIEVLGLQSGAARERLATWITVSNT